MPSATDAATATVPDSSAGRARGDHYRLMEEEHSERALRQLPPLARTVQAEPLPHAKESGGGGCVGACCRCSVVALLVASWMSGLFKGLFGVGGPPYMVYLMLFPLPKDEWRRASCLERLGGNAASLTAFLAVHGTAPPPWGQCAALMAGGGLGLLTGNVLSRYVSPARFAGALVLFLCFSSVTMARAIHPWPPRAIHG